MFLLICLSMCALASAHDYSDISLKFSFESIIDDAAALKRHIDCYLDRGPCDEIASHYRRHIAESLEDGCRDCSDHVKHNIRVFHNALKTSFPADYLAIRQKYDPTGSKFDFVDADVQKY